MMASRKSKAATQRPKQKSTKQVGMMQFVLVGAGIIVLIVVALLLFGGGKKTAAPQAKVAAADTISTYGKARKPSGVAVKKVSRAKAAHDSLTAKRHEERLKQEQQQKQCLLLQQQRPFSLLLRSDLR